MPPLAGPASRARSLLAALVAAIAPPAFAQDVPAPLTATWTARAPLPAPVGEVGVAALDGVVYVVGGTEQTGEGPMDADFASTQVWAYDPATDAWAARAPLPEGLTHVSVAGLDGRLYALGGFADVVHMDPQPTAFAYDPAANAWTTLAPMPRALGSVALAALDGKIHVLGGRDSRTVKEAAAGDGGPSFSEGLGTINDHSVFDPATGAWTELAPIPGPPRDHVGVAVLDGRIHLFGGREEEFEQNLARHDVYDPATDSWGVAAPLPAPRSAGASAVINGRILYAGGECRPGGEAFTPNTFDEVDAYDPATDAWTALPPLPQGGRHAFGAGVVGDAAYFAGGAQFCGGGATTDLVELVLR